jgi:hypothetical protein
MPLSRVFRRPVHPVSALGDRLLRLVAAPLLLGGVLAAPALAGEPVRLDELTPRVLRQAGVFSGQVQVLPEAAKRAADATTPRAAWSLPVRLDDQDVVLLLEPVNLRAPGYVASEVVDGVRRAIVAPRDGHYAGVVAGLAGTTVRLSIVPTGVRAMIDMGRDGAGVDRTYFLQPATDVMPQDQRANLPPGLHIAHRSDQLRPLAMAALCGGGVPTGLVQSSAKGTVSPTCVRELQLALEADFPYYQANSSDTLATIADMESVINVMAPIYQRDLGVVPVISSTNVRTAADPYTSTVSGTLLSQFRSEWNANFGGVTRDLAHLFTGREIDGSTIGIAYLTATCGSFGYGVSQARFTGNLQSRVGLVAHEIGHNMSAAHCNGDTDCAIMCASLGGCSGNLTRFGTRSVNSVRSNLAFFSCLAQISPPATAVDPRAVNDVVNVAAGGTIDIDVLVNDFDGNCQAVTLATFPSVTPRGATVTRLVGAGPNGRDTIRYVAPLAFSGADPFTYTISDGTRNGSGTVTVNSLTPRVPENPPYFRPELDEQYFALSSGVSVLPNFSTLAPYLTGTAADINLPSTNGVFSDSGRSDNVAAAYTGFLVVPTDGLYTLFTESDDGSRLFIGSERVVNNDGLHGMIEAAGQINMRAGRHAFRVDFFEAGGGAGLIVLWQGPGIAKAPIPAGSFARNTPRCGLSDVSGPGLLNGFDGELTADDIIFFINAFTSGGQSADIAGPGGSAQPDGERTADDVILFISRFTTGC